MSLNNILLVVLFALASTATCQVFQPDGPAQDYEFKYLVQLTIEVKLPRRFKEPNPIFTGGGVIVNNQWILTVAHNFDPEVRRHVNYFPNKVTVLAGTKNMNSKSNAQEISVSFKNVIIHEDYKDPDSPSDIALIFLGDSSLSYNNRVQPAELIKPGWMLTLSSKCRIVGWGAYKDKRGKTIDPVVARKGHLYIINSVNCERCLNDKPVPFFYDNFHLCYGCKGCKGCSMGSPGDSGGPVVQNIQGKEVVVGLNRGGAQRYIEECGQDSPGLAVKISVFRDWIDKKIKDQKDKEGNEQKQKSMAVAVAVASVAAAFFINRRFR